MCAQPRRCAATAATVLLPLADTPMTTTTSQSSSRAAAYGVSSLTPSMMNHPRWADINGAPVPAAATTAGTGGARCSCSARGGDDQHPANQTPRAVGPGVTGSTG